MSRRTPPFQPNEIVSTLVHHEVAFVIIGGIAAVLQGVPYTTFDFDIVYSRSDLAGPKLLRTRFGRLDVLGELDGKTTWESLLEHSVELPFGANRVRVLSLATLIAVKERLGRDKDKAALPLLRATLERQRR